MVTGRERGWMDALSEYSIRYVGRYRGVLQRCFVFIWRLLSYHHNVHTRRSSEAMPPTRQLGHEIPRPPFVAQVARRWMARKKVNMQRRRHSRQASLVNIAHLRYTTHTLREPCWPRLKRGGKCEQWFEGMTSPPRPLGSGSSGGNRGPTRWAALLEATARSSFHSPVSLCSS